MSHSFKFLETPKYWQSFTGSSWSNWILDLNRTTQFFAGELGMLSDGKGLKHSHVVKHDTDNKTGLFSLAN